MSMRLRSKKFALLIYATWANLCSTIACNGEMTVNERRSTNFSSDALEARPSNQISQQKIDSIGAQLPKAQGNETSDPIPISAPNSPAPPLGKPNITGISHLAAAPGTRVNLTGHNLPAKLILHLLTPASDINAFVLADSSTEAHFFLPEGAPLGMITGVIGDAKETNLTDPNSVVDDGTPVAMISLINTGPNQDIPIYLGDASVLCSTVAFRDSQGNLAHGTKDCSRDNLPQCQNDGEQNCFLGNDLRALNPKSLDSSKIHSGYHIAGVAGQETVCTDDRTVNCYISDDSVYAAARLDAFSKSDVREGVTIAGVTGTMKAAPNACNDEGMIGCITTSNIRSVNWSKILPENLKTGLSISTVNGTLTPAPASCAIDGQISCVANSNFVSANKSMLLTGNIRSGVTIGGILGQVTPSPALCTTDAQLACVTQATYPAVSISSVLPQNIKNGITLAGVTGKYPSSTYPLAGTDSTPDLDEATFDAKIKSPATFAWFTSSGTKQMYNGDPNITPTNIRTNVTIFGSTGTLLGGLACSSDGATGCVTTGRYISADKQAFTAWDIRKGKTVAGVDGALVFYKNMAKISLYDRMVGTGAIDGLDIYDTTDDHANVGTFPTENPPGFDQATGANWVREALSDNGTGGGTAGNGLCDGGEACLYSDRTTGLTWIRSDGVQRTFENAITNCDGLTLSGYSDFRLPTQKELLQAYVDGIWAHKSASELNLMAFNWSSTTVSYAFGSGWIVYLNYGYSSSTAKTSTAANTCVRP